jgi:hypothetical protein
MDNKVTYPLHPEFYNDSDDDSDDNLDDYEETPMQIPMMVPTASGSRLWLYGLDRCGWKGGECNLSYSHGDWAIDELETKNEAESSCRAQEARRDE